MRQANWDGQKPKHRGKAAVLGHDRKKGRPTWNSRNSWTPPLLFWWLAELFWPRLQERGLVHAA
jgi:hypothetical protein